MDLNVKGKPGLDYVSYVSWRPKGIGEVYRRVCVQLWEDGRRWESACDIVVVLEVDIEVWLLAKTLREAKR